MRTGYTISAIGHALVLGWGLVWFSAKPLEVPPTDSVVADVISETEFSQLTAGSQNAKQTPKPAPVVDKAGDVKAPPKDPTLKVSDKQEVQTATATPPAPPQPDVKPPDPKPPEAKPAEPQSATAPATAAPPVPDPIAEALQREEAKKKEEAKKLEEAKKREEVKVDLDRIQTALLDKRTPQRQAVTGTMVNPTPALGTTTGTAPELSQNELARLQAMLKAQLTSCWNPPVGVREAKDLIVKVGFSLNRDGSLSGAPIVLNRGSNPLFRVAAESAVRAVLSCQPLRLPPSRYEWWQQVEVNFDPIDMFGG